MSVADRVTDVAEAYASMSSQLNGLAARLTDPRDRETYATLVSYFDSLPPGDEMLKLAQLLGLLSLLGQRIPDAVAELLAELRASAATTGELNALLDTRLANLTAEITAKIDVPALAESVRQVAGAELREVREVAKAVTAQLRLLATHAAGASTLIVQEKGKLTAATLQMQHAAAVLDGKAKAARTWLWSLAVGVAFLAGIVVSLLVSRP